MNSFSHPGSRPSAGACTAATASGLGRPGRGPGGPRRLPTLRPQGVVNMVATDRVRLLLADARSLYDDAIEMLDQGKIRNAAEKAWGATKRATGALVLARHGEEPQSAGPARPTAAEQPGPGVRRVPGPVQHQVGAPARQLRTGAGGSGSIHAWAGQPKGQTWNGFARWVYPRVGGATPGQRRLGVVGVGLSPRGRGNPATIPNLQHSNIRSIPAWAGQPDMTAPAQRLQRSIPA